MAARRSGLVFGAFALILSVCLNADKMTAAGQPDERVISFYHIHTEERLTVVYKRNGKYIPEAMQKINYIMRDWRKNQIKEIAPATIDLAWEMHEELGSKEPINIICGYRSAATNEMLRETVGGQAKFSQHITGKAIDITFPDIPLKKMRYSALIRERGGVGYYPTSGVPFIHIDTANVRMWPRMPRQELALLFPDGHSKFVPADGRPITPSDVRVARSRFGELATQVAEFFHDRREPGTSRTMVASLGISPPKKSLDVVASLNLGSRAKTADGSTRRTINLTTEPDPSLTPPVRPFAPPTQVASLESDDSQPRLLSAPKPVERSSLFTLPSKADRGKLDALVASAASMPMPELIQAPQPAVRPQKALAAAALADENRKPAAAPIAQVASLDPSAGTAGDTSAPAGGEWAQAPAYDDDHPDEMDYRPFPLAPFLTDKPTARDQPLAPMQAPDVAATLNVLDDAGVIEPMKLRPGRQLAEAMWCDQFKGKAVHAEALQELEQNRIAATGITSRQVQTSAR
ncbi:MAG: DUF882 domain-containing protein [Hyphomicrobium sp.]|uniref:DUF882 domain-containing protein n=1 Tax=Hyphomicrobium sp. TaxID=82 RepID=UPI0039E5423D